MTAAMSVLTDWHCTPLASAYRTYPFKAQGDQGISLCTDVWAAILDVLLYIFTPNFPGGAFLDRCSQSTSAFAVSVSGDQSAPSSLLAHAFLSSSARTRM